MQKFPENPKFLQQVHSSALREIKIIQAHSKNPSKRGLELIPPNLLIKAQGEPLSLGLMSSCTQGKARKPNQDRNLLKAEPSMQAGPHSAPQQPNHSKIKYLFHSQLPSY